MGNKFDLLPQLLHIFPKKINTFYDLFGGSGVVTMNVKANKKVYNEINQNILNILSLFKEYSPKEIDKHIRKRIDEFDLPTEGNDVRQPNVNEKRIEKYKKNYNNFRNFYNKSNKNYLDLYTLTFFSFCNMIRFNSKNEFNMPFGNRTYTEENMLEIETACYIMEKEKFEVSNKSAFDILDETKFEKDDFVYLDPPYLNTEAIYNEKRAFGGWNIDDDYELFKRLNKLNENGVKWCMSNVKENKGKKNKHLIEWANKNGYRVVGMNKNYSALGKGSANTYEVCIINYEYEGEGFKVFQEKLF